MGRAKFKGNGGKRDGTRFITLPMVVLDSPGYRLAGHPARALLIDIAMQYTGHNNGKLTACAKYLRAKGWRSNDTIVRARRELLECGLLIETRKGARPNKAAWYALSWLDLDQGQGLDFDPKSYPRGAYMTPDRPTVQIASLAPWGGAEEGRIAPSGGARASTPAPSGGAVRGTSTPSPAPSGGAYLEIPSTQALAGSMESAATFSPELLANLRLKPGELAS